MYSTVDMWEFNRYANGRKFKVWYTAVHCITRFKVYFEFFSAGNKKLKNFYYFDNILSRILNSNPDYNMLASGLYV